MSVFLLAVVIILAGLAMVVLSRHAGSPALVLVVWWVGVVLVVVGLVLLLTPVVVWANGVLRSALGV